MSSASADQIAPETRMPENPIKPWYPFLSKWSASRIFIVVFCLTGIPPLATSLIEGTAFGPVPQWDDPDPRYAYFGPFFVWPIMFTLLFPLIASLIQSFYHQVNHTQDLAWRDHVIQYNNAQRKRKDPYLITGWPLGWIILKYAVVTIFAISTIFIYWFGVHPIVGSGSKGILSQTLCTGTWIVGPYKLLNGDWPGVSLVFFAAAFAQFVIIFVIANTTLDFFHWAFLISALKSKKYSICIEPIVLHPDTAAGLSQFGKSCWRFYVALLAFGFFVIFQMSEKIVVYKQINNVASQVCLKAPARTIFENPANATNEWLKVKQTIEETIRAEHEKISQRKEQIVAQGGGKKPKLTTEGRVPVGIWEIISSYKAVPFTFLVLFLIIVPATILLPMLPLRALLVDKKRSSRLAISEHVRAAPPDQFADPPGADHVVQLSRVNLHDVDGLRKIYSWIDEVPLWPFDRRTLTRLFYTYTVPFVAFVSQLLAPSVFERVLAVSGLN
jgi:hypothetical protein